MSLTDGRMGIRPDRTELIEYSWLKANRDLKNINAPKMLENNIISNTLKKLNCPFVKFNFRKTEKLTDFPFVKSRNFISAKFNIREI